MSGEIYKYRKDIQILGEIYKYREGYQISGDIQMSGEI